MPTQSNVHAETVAGFGDEWTRFDQRGASVDELDRIFASYFGVFDWTGLPVDAVGFDLGCGSGRWAKRVAPRVGKLYCVDASASALKVAERMLAGHTNVEFVHASVDRLPFEPGSMDFGYSLGVLHHVPDTLAGLQAATRLLKPNAQFLLYLYYAFDNRPAWFRALWRASDVLRRGVSRLPHAPRAAAADALAATLYWPLARGAKLAERAGMPVSVWPLAAYRDKSFYVMRNDALDRFGTALEQRFTKREIEHMMRAAGLEELRFSDEVFWAAVGLRRG